MKLNKSLIIKTISYEDKVFRDYLDIAGLYKNDFNELNCELIITRYWFNFYYCISSEERLPLKNGYQCIIACRVLKNGNLVKIDSPEPYTLISTWVVSQVTRHGFSLEYNTYCDISDVKNDINDMLINAKRIVTGL